MADTKKKSKGVECGLCGDVVWSVLEGAKNCECGKTVATFSPPGVIRSVNREDHKVVDVTLLVEQYEMLSLSREGKVTAKKVS